MHRASHCHPLQLVCFVAMAVSRAANVWPCAALINYLRLPADLIPQSHQLVLWWAGLRGAMAFAIALEAADAVPGMHGCPSWAGCLASTSPADHHLCEQRCGSIPGAAVLLESHFQHCRNSSRYRGSGGEGVMSGCLPPRLCSAGGRGELMLSATYLIVLATVLENGGTCALLLERLGLKLEAMQPEGNEAHPDKCVAAAAAGCRSSRLPRTLHRWQPQPTRVLPACASSLIHPAVTHLPHPKLLQAKTAGAVPSASAPQQHGQHPRSAPCRTCGCRLEPCLARHDRHFCRVSCVAAADVLPACLRCGLFSGLHPPAATFGAALLMSAWLSMDCWDHVKFWH